MNQGSFPGRGKETRFSRFHKGQNSTWAHPATKSMGTGGSIPWDKATRASNWSLNSNSTKAKKAQSYAFIASCLLWCIN